MDPAVPVVRMVTVGFAATGSKIPWTELKRRSALDPSDPAYVMPEAVEAMKSAGRSPVGSSLLSMETVVSDRAGRTP